MTRPATTGRRSRTTVRWMLFAAASALAVTGYLSQREQIFTWLAAGTEWVLVTCGLATPDDAGMADDRLRRLYYAARMFRALPPRNLVPLDAWAEQTFPGMGFGVIRTFDTRPVPVVIGGWLFRIPCTYLSDARQCAKVDANTARLKVDIDDLEPIRPHRISAFLATASPEILRITLLGTPPVAPALPPGYVRVAINNRSASGVEGADMFYCLDPELARQRALFEHCLLRYAFSADVTIELYFAAEHRNDGARLRRESLALVAGFEVRR